MNAWSDSAHSRRKPSEQAVSIARKTRRRPTTGRAGLDGCAPRSTHGKPEPRFSGLRSSVFDANAPTRLGAFASKTELRRPEKRGSGLPWVERGAQPSRPARPVVGLRRVFRAIETACSDGFRRECAESLQAFMNNQG